MLTDWATDSINASSVSMAAEFIYGRRYNMNANHTGTVKPLNIFSSKHVLLMCPSCYTLPKKSRQRPSSPVPFGNTVLSV